MEEKFKTNVDNAFDSDEARAGIYWFLIRPGLAKWRIRKGARLETSTDLVNALVGFH